VGLAIGTTRIFDGLIEHHPNHFLFQSTNETEILVANLKDAELLRQKGVAARFHSVSGLTSEIVQQAEQRGIPYVMLENHEVIEVSTHISMGVVDPTQWSPELAKRSPNRFLSSSAPWQDMRLPSAGL
jgi:hypothetical protein